MFCICILLFTGTVNVYAEDPATDVDIIMQDNDSEISGKCGENVACTPESGALTISGSGAMKDYDGSYSITYSPMSYVRTCINLNNAQANICRALYLYYKATETFFTQ